jgi:hypothetical protein
MPDFTRWPSFPFEGDMRVKPLAAPVDAEPPRSGEDANECAACNTPDDAYIWAGERWRVRAMDRPTGLPVVVILECRSHLDLGDLPNLLAAELGVMTVRLERAIRSLDGVARVHVNRWGDGAAHLHMWFLARPYGRLQLRGTFLSLWDDILPVIPEQQWRENLALVAAWLAEFGGEAIAGPAHIEWESPSTINFAASLYEYDQSRNGDDRSSDSRGAESPDPAGHDGEQAGADRRDGDDGTDARSEPDARGSSRLTDTVDLGAADGSGTRPDDGARPAGEGAGSGGNTGRAAVATPAGGSGRAGVSSPPAGESGRAVEKTGRPRTLGDVGVARPVPPATVNGSVIPPKSTGGDTAHSQRP